MSSLPHKLALAAATVLLLASCGGSDDSGDADGSSTPASGASESSGGDAPDATDGGSESPDGADGTGGGGAGSVAREAFCSAIDPQAVADLLGLDSAEVIAEYAPDDEIPTGTDTAPIVSPNWTCTIGTTSDGSIGATWNVGNVDATPKDVAVTIQRQGLALGKDTCTDADDDTLGPGTRGIDCSGDAPGGTSFTLAARSNVVGGTQIDCSIASTRGDEVSALTEALPELCGLFYDAVVR